jgi:predicted kinase
LICKDTIKEALFDHLGAGDRAWSQRLGYAIIQALYALAEDILNSGASLILENTFNHPDTPGELGRLLANTGARLSVVYCYAPPRVLAARFNARNASRHPGHRDRSDVTPTQVTESGWLYRPDYPGQVILVDTTDFDTVNMADIVRQWEG